MAYATLSIDLEARLAKLQQGMDAGYRLAEANASKIAGAYKGAAATIGSLAGAVGLAFGGTAIAGFVRQTIDGLDALNDFADVIGTTVENASALEDAAARTGTALETVEGIALRLNKTLADAKPGSEQARVLDAIGLSAAELRKQDPAEALLQVATALQGVGDQDQAALVLQLFGKSAREAAPFLKDLAAQGRLVATVTADQAREAELVNKQLAALSKNATDFARVIGVAVLPALNQALQRLQEFSRGPGIFSATLEALKGNSFANAQQGLEFYNAEIAKLDQRIEALKNDKRPLVAAFAGPRIQELREQRAELDRFATAYRNLLNAGNAGQGRGDFEAAPPLALNLDALLRGNTPTGRPAVEPRPRFEAPADPGLASALRALEQTDVAKVAELEARLRALFDLQRETRGTPAVAEAIANTRAELERLTAQPIGPAIQEQEERLRSQFLLSEKAGYDDTDVALRRVTESTERATDAARELGLTFASALEDTILQGREASDVIDALVKDLARVFIRRNITEPLANGAAGFFEGLFGQNASAQRTGAGATGNGWGQLLSQFFAGFFADGGFIPPGMWGMTGERGPEPVYGGRTGATVVPNSGRAQTNYFNFNIPPGTSRETAQQVASMAARAIANAQRRNG